jgi:hypothetical protein
MITLVVEDVPCIFLVHGRPFELAYSWLRNLKLHNFAPDQAKYYRVEGRKQNSFESQN